MEILLIILLAIGCWWLWRLQKKEKDDEKEDIAF